MHQNLKNRDFLHSGTLLHAEECINRAKIKRVAGKRDYIISAATQWVCEECGQAEIRAQQIE